jgi:hypothetical protein
MPRGSGAPDGELLSLRDRLVRSTRARVAPACRRLGRRRPVHRHLGRGQRISRDRLIVECATVDQLVHRADGRVERIAPALSDDDIARKELEKERAELERQKRIKEDRADRLPVSRFPNKDALTGARTAIRIAQERIAALESEQRRLADEAEFYPAGRPLPPKLKSDVDRNDAALKAQRALLQNQQGEQARTSCTTNSSAS